ncbi:glycoside hydrolase family 43 protein [Rhabdobacter roseus]|uniref:GH43 family beta-xylosidase n=1 Tax=Rhabdobacter roseus TaxID=1655419 RepID=A0A840TLG1_9BACT|nr:glycoside hydrolase family 43 protein [Rhabdobacter roseus]MBB5283775.1 GH43 family beta-xylosidase [Rhabdobacter roseus]
MINQLFSHRYLKVLVLLAGYLVSSSAAQSQTFTNPLLPSGADPWMIYHDGWYYYTHTTGRDLRLWKTRQPVELASAEHRVVWTPPDTGAYAKEIWAPELHFLQNKWYIYVAADDGRNENHRIWVLENPSPDPLQGTWTVKGKLADPGDHWAIDLSVFEHNQQLYAVWSGWEGYQNVSQDIYIARLENPWTMQGDRVRIATPTHDWEKRGSGNGLPVVNEGPQLLRQSPTSQKLFIVFSASGCWTDHYALGYLQADATANLLDPGSWRKHPEPVFRQVPELGIYGPGHNSFFRTPSGQDWILYHANPSAGDGCGRKRAPHAQPFGWRTDGTPDFGSPLSRKPLPVPR